MLKLPFKDTLHLHYHHHFASPLLSSANVAFWSPSKDAISWTDFCFSRQIVFSSPKHQIGIGHFIAFLTFKTHLKICITLCELTNAVRNFIEVYKKDYVHRPIKSHGFVVILTILTQVSRNPHRNLPSYTVFFLCTCWRMFFAFSKTKIIRTEL